MADNLTKYFRTHHLPWSEAVEDDDIVAPSPFTSEDVVVVTLKMDGENTSLYPSGYTHARSIDSVNHESRDYVKAYWRERAYNLPEGWRVCGENMFAKHSIFYNNLKSYLYVFSIWDDENRCLSWQDTEDWCNLLNLVHVPVIYHGLYDEKLIKEAFKPYKAEHEGYVIRISDSFDHKYAYRNIAKCVRKNHVQTDSHWMHQKIVPNELEKNDV